MCLYKVSQFSDLEAFYNYKIVKVPVQAYFLKVYYYKFLCRIIRFYILKYKALGIHNALVFSFFLLFSIFFMYNNILNTIVLSHRKMQNHCVNAYPTTY